MNWFSNIWNPLRNDHPLGIPWFNKDKVREIKKDECLHLACSKCHGTGWDEYGRRCVHMISCPCSRCNPTYCSYGKDFEVHW
jgi:hypothetical protein